MTEQFIYHLKGNRFSGRGIKLRDLDPGEVSKARLHAAQECGKGASAFEIEARRRIECVYRMLVEVTEKRDLSTLEGAKWVPVTQEQLEEPDGKMSFAKLFTAKDFATINYLCSKLIDVGDEEIEAIEGGVLTVSGD